MSPYSGLFDLFEARQLLVKEGNRYKYTLGDGTEIKLYKKEYERNEDSCFDKMMIDVTSNPTKLTGWAGLDEKTEEEVVE
jgi:hypothetical protein